jgi:hypothetical protein
MDFEMGMAFTAMGSDGMPIIRNSMVVSPIPQRTTYAM